MKWAIDIEKRIGRWPRAWRKYSTREAARAARWTKFGKYNNVKITKVV